MRHSVLRLLNISGLGQPSLCSGGGAFLSRCHLSSRQRFVWAFYGDAPEQVQMEYYVVSKKLTL